MEIDWMVVGFEALNFAVLVAVLRRFLFRPAMAMLETRRAEIEKQRLETDERQAEIDQVRVDYERRLASVDHDARARLEAAEEEGRQRAGRLIDEARAEVSRQVEATRTECDAARRRALDDVRGELFRLATAAAGRVVGHMGDGDVTVAFARRGARALKAVLDEPPSPADAVAVTLPRGSDTDAVVAALRSVLGKDLTFTTRTDPAMIGGVRLTLGSHEIESSASATLGHWYEQQARRGDAPPQPLRGAT